MKKLLIAVAILLLSSCSGGSDIDSKIAGEHANVVVEVNLEPINEIYTTIAFGLFDSMSENMYKDESKQSDAAKTFDLAKTFLEDYDVYNMKMLGAVKIDEKYLADNPDIDSYDREEYKNFITGSGFFTINNKNSQKILSDLYKGMQKGSTMTEAERVALEEELSKKAEVFDDEENLDEQEIKKFIDENSEAFGIIFYEQLLQDIGEENEEKIKTLGFDKIEEENGEFIYQYDENQSLGRSLAYNKNFQNLKKHRTGEVIYSYYFDYEDFLPILKESYEKDTGEAFTIDAIMENIGSDFDNTGLPFDFQSDGRSLLEVLLEGKTLALGVTKDQTKLAMRLDIATGASESAESLIKNYKPTIEGFVQGGANMYALTLSKLEGLSTEDATYIKEMGESVSIDVSYEAGFLSIVIEFDMIDEERFAALVSDAYAKLMESYIDEQQYMYDGSSSEEDFPTL